MDARDHLIAAGLRAGKSQRAIAEDIGISGPAVNMRIKRSPELRKLQRTKPESPQSVAAYRRQLHLVELDARAIARRVRAALKAIDEEAEAAAVNEILGLRPQSPGSR